MTPKNEVVRFGDVRVDVADERVWKGDQRVDLEPKAFGVLSYLLDHPGRLVPKQELLDVVWRGTAVTDNALTRVVAQLRRAIGDDARDARYIETVPTRGYRFIGEIRRAEIQRTEPEAGQGAPQPIEAVSHLTGQAPRAGTTGRRVLVAGTIALTLGAFGLGAFWLRSGTEGGPTTPAAGVQRNGVQDGAGSSSPGNARGSAPGSLPGASLAVAAASAGPYGPVRQATFSLDLDLYPSFSHDGSMLAYSSLRDGNLDLFVQSFTPGSQTRQVTQDGQQNVQPDWSPNGQYLAYHTIARGGVWVLPAGGGTTRQIVEVGSAPRWSPDGRTIAYQTGEVQGLDVSMSLAPSGLWLTSFPDGVRRPLTQPGQPAGGHSQPSWSADGRRIVFVAQPTGPAEIWTIDVANGRLTRLLTCGYFCGTPALDVDGRALYYTASEPTRGIWRVALSDDGRSTAGDPVLLHAALESDVLGLTLRRNGEQLAFALATVRSNLESIAVPVTPPMTPRSPSAGTAPKAGAAARAGAGDGTGASRTPVPLATPVAITRDTSRRNTWPAFSPDGQRLIFMSNRSGSGRTVWLSARDGTGARQVTVSVPIALFPVWLPNGDEIAYLSERDGRMALVASSITTGRERVVRAMAIGSLAERDRFLHARLMPDAMRFVYARVTEGIANLWVEEVGGAGRRQLTHDTESAGYPTISRDGRWLAYEVVRGASMHVAVLPHEGGGEARVLTSGRGLFWPHSFSADGDRIALAFRRDGLWRLGWISRTTGALVPLTTPVPASAFVRYPEWSPRGDRIVYERAQVSGNIWLATLRPAMANTPRRDTQD